MKVNITRFYNGNGLKKVDILTHDYLEKINTYHILLSTNDHEMTELYLKPSNPSDEGVLKYLQKASDDFKNKSINLMYPDEFLSEVSFIRRDEDEPRD